MYQYKAKVLEIYDGDSMTLLISVGFNIYLEEKVRLLVIDCPEIRTKNKKEKALAYEARDYLRELLLKKEVIIETEKEVKWGRYLVDVYFEGMHINKHLIDIGYAKKYDGGTKKPWF